MTARSLITILVLCLVAAASSHAADKDDTPTGDGVVGGTITDGVNLWGVVGPAPEEGTFNDLEVPIGSDHQYATWWWYRVQGDTAESRMPFPDTESYVGALATFTWADVDGRGLFSAELNVFLVAQGLGGALLSSLDITNISAAPLDLDLFAYNDMDMNGSSGGDTAVEASPTQIDISDTSVAFFIGNQADAYAADSFPVVRNALNDDDLDDFTSTGLPFGPGDFAGAYQWSRVLSPGGLDTFASLICVDTLDQCPSFFVIFEDNFETGDTGVWDVTVP